MRKKQTQKEQNNMEVLILDSGYVPQSQKKQTEKGGMFLSFLVLFGAVGVLAGSLVSAFSIRDERLWLLIPGIFLFSLFFSWFYADRRLDSKRIYGFLAIVILYMAVCFVLQNRITAGFYQTADFVMSRINQVYHGNMRLYGAYESGDMVIFWLPVLFPVTGLGGWNCQKEKLASDSFHTVSAGRTDDDRRRQTGKSLDVFSGNEHSAFVYCRAELFLWMESGAYGTSCCCGRICPVMVYFHAIGRSGDPGNSKRHDKDTESAPAVSVEFSTEDFRGKSAALSGRYRRRGGQRRTRNDRRCVFYRGGCPESDQCAETFGDGLSERIYR